MTADVATFRCLLSAQLVAIDVPSLVESRYSFAEIWFVADVAEILLETRLLLTIDCVGEIQ